MSTLRASAFATETVWNTGLAGTGATSDGRSLTVGHQGEWTPEHLLLLATESCFMSTLLALASVEGIAVLGYVSSGHLEIPDDARLAPLVSLSPCVVVGSERDAHRVAVCAKQAEKASVVARLLGSRVRVNLEVRVVPADGS
jgi:organic hydroperoxide reductase OsmC/OhrA